MKAPRARKPPPAAARPRRLQRLEGHTSSTTVRRRCMASRVPAVRAAGSGRHATRGPRCPRDSECRPQRQGDAGLAIRQQRGARRPWPARRRRHRRRTPANSQMQGAAIRIRCERPGAPQISNASLRSLSSRDPLCADLRARRGFAMSGTPGATLETSYPRAMRVHELHRQGARRNRKWRSVDGRGGRTSHSSVATAMTRTRRGSVAMATGPRRPRWVGLLVPVTDVRPRSGPGPPGRPVG